MKRVLQRPFPPLAEKKQRLRSAFLIALFVFGFLYIFKPFGLSEVSGNLLLVAALYGLITLVILLITQFLFPDLFEKYYSDQKWTVGKEIFQSMANVLLIAVGNFLLSCYLGFFPWSWNSFILFVGFTFAVGIMPIVVQVLLRQNIYHRRNAKAVVEDNQIIAKRLDKEFDSLMISVSAKDGAEAFQGNADEVLAIESSGNYIEIHRIEGKPFLIRKSLNATEKELPDVFFRTHRSWIVNMSQIRHVDGNARGYTLSFSHSEVVAPVSRGKLKAFDSALQKTSN